jgi:hypothetical protein
MMKISDSLHTIWMSVLNVKTWGAEHQSGELEGNERIILR